MAIFFIGLMSGTSLDGVDVALVDIQTSIQCVATHFVEFPAEIRSQALALQSPSANELHSSQEFSIALAKLYAIAVHELLSIASVDFKSIQALACHGQTIRHRPDLGYSVQLINPAWLAETTGIPVICDFRARDIAAGGEGAPLVPAFHDTIFRSPIHHRAILNIGGISNVTDLCPNKATGGFDTGPGNLLMDSWINKHHGTRYDAEGRWACAGSVLPELLDRLLAVEFFTRRPPKSYGREQFNDVWLNAQLAGNERPEDVQATLAQLTIKSAADGIRMFCGTPAELYVCGGGAHNPVIMEGLKAALPESRVTTTTSLGIPPDWVEAIAFAWLGSQFMRRLPGNLPDVTGARGPRILGALYPA